jgi:protein SOK2
MINGTKLLNVAGMSRGKRDGILKNEKGRVVVKVGAMHLKGVWYVVIIIYMTKI